jgi:hypothetical protein
VSGHADDVVETLVLMNGNAEPSVEVGLASADAEVGRAERVILSFHARNRSSGDAVLCIGKSGLSIARANPSIGHATREKDGEILFPRADRISFGAAEWSIGNATPSGCKQDRSIGNADSSTVKIG